MEDKKKEIFEFITNVLDFKPEEEGVFKKSHVQIVRQVFMNNQRLDQAVELNYEIRFIGEGHIENGDGSKHEPTLGFQFKINHHYQGDIWARDLQDFTYLLSSRRI